MRIGVPREIKVHEYRVGLVPAGVRELTAAAVPAGPDASSYAERILQSAESDTGDDICLVVVRIL